MFRRKSESIPTPDVLNDRLREIGGMSQEILDANRAGKLNPMQQQGYARMMGTTSANKGTLMIISLVIFMFVVAGIVIAFRTSIGQFNRNVPADNSMVGFIGIGGSMLVYFGLLGYGIYRGRKIHAQKPEDVVVYNVIGKVKVIKVDPATGRKLRDNDKRYGYSVVKVKRKQLYALSPVVYKALVDGAQYRLYYVNSIGRFATLVSAEAV